MNLKQENNYEKFKQDVDMWIDNTQYWINSYSKRASEINVFIFVVIKS